MDIIQRNFFRLLRSGAFNTTEQIEPMSVFKWGRLYQLSLMHDVAAYTYDGLQHCRQQFFLHLSENQWKEWQKAASQPHGTEPEEMEEDNFLRPDHLTNPVLNHQLQNILDDEDSDTASRQLLLIIVRIARHLLNEGMPVRQLVELGYFLRRESHRIDFITLRKWINSLRLSQMVQLEGEMLTLLFCFEPAELPFLEEKRDKRIERIAQELVEFTNTRSQDWYFSQEGDNIFVRNNNTTAMFSHVRRSARYFRYYPSESITNFFASFLHSLSHIEE